MVDQPLHEKIEAYLLGQLPPEEAAAFKKEMEGDPQLAEEVELHRLILPVSDRLAEMDLHNDFARWRQEMEAAPPASPSPAKTRNRLPGLIALALLICAGAFLLWQYMEGRVATERAERQRAEQELQDARTENERLKQENNLLQDQLRAAAPSPEPAPQTPAPKNPAPKTVIKEPIAAASEPEYLQWADEELIAYADDMLESFRTRSARGNLPGETLIAKADTAIQHRRYREAAALLRSVKPDDPMYPKSLEIRAFVHFKRRQYTDAVSTYQKYREYNRDTDKTDWDLCLFYLADYPRYKNELRALLNGILSDPRHPKYRDAVKLQERLKSLNR